MIGALVQQTLAMKRAIECDHAWVKLNDTEDQCSVCTTIATPEGKRYLERQKARIVVG